MAVKFKVVKRKVLNGAEKDSVKNYAIAKTSGTSDLNKLCKFLTSSMRHPSSFRIGIDIK